MSDGEQIRACLWCGKKFASTGPGNRKCGTCRKRQADNIRKIPYNREWRAKKSVAIEDEN